MSIGVNPDPSSQTGHGEGIVPLVSFTDTMANWAADDEGVTSHARLPPADSSKLKPSIIFQNVDIKEGGIASDSGRTEIHLFGVTQDGHSILARVSGLRPYFFYPAPAGITGDDLIPLRDHLNNVPAIPNPYPLIEKIEVVNKRTRSNNEETSPYLRIVSTNQSAMQAVQGIIGGGHCQYRNLFFPRSCANDPNIALVMRFMIDKGINAMEWLHIAADEYESIPQEGKLSHCQLEVSLNLEALKVCDVGDIPADFAPLRIMSFDIETHVPSFGGQTTFPKGEVDPVYQIGCMVMTYGQSEPTVRAIFTLDSCSPIVGAQVRSFTTEYAMLQAWHDFFIELDPDVIIGHNILQFDIPFLLKRGIALNLPDFACLNRIKGSPQVLPPFRITMSNCPGYEGRLILDIFHQIRLYEGVRETGSHTLNTLSNRFLGEHKEQMHFSRIPILQSGSADNRRELAVYCLKDVYLCLLLLSKLGFLEKETNRAKEHYLLVDFMRAHQDWGKYYECSAVAKQGLRDAQGNFVPDFVHLVSCTVQRT